MDKNLVTGQRYWTAYVNEKILYYQVLNATWRDDQVDHRREREGRIFASKSEAETWATSTLKIA